MTKLFRLLLPGLFVVLVLMTPLSIFAQSTEIVTPSQIPELRAQNSRSDSADILDISIDLDLRDMAGKYIEGSATIQFTTLIASLSVLPLDLQGLHIDSVHYNGNDAGFLYDGLLLSIDLLPVSTAGDTGLVTVWYNGNPEKDADWGGFYYSGDYAFNLGVAFTSSPHNFGRIWFPCFDNFTERSTYHFHMRTAADRPAYCNGMLDSTHINTDSSITRTWTMNQPIPSYLASVASGQYEQIEDVYSGLAGDIPILIAAEQADTANARNHFRNLHAAIEQFEASYGPHRFDRIGFTLVPFSGGAMEHATNIAYPRFAISGGGLDYETLYAHELSHHWWGDLVTCRTAEDMWINEGWASWSERRFQELVYGPQRYADEIAANHFDVLHLTHITDDGYRALSGVPHDYTYGSTVYDKGADVVHTLRGYMGDTDFFSCITDFLDTYAFEDVSSEDLQDFLTDCSGVDMEPFFQGWVFNAGWPQVSVDSVWYQPIEGGKYYVRCWLRQRLNHAPDFFEKIPLDIRFMDDSWQTFTTNIKMSGVCGWFDVISDVEPVYTSLDPGARISQAVTSDTKTISSTGSFDFENGMFDLEVNGIGDSALIRIIHNWVPPSGFITPHPGLHLSDYRYWTVEGLIPDGFTANGTIKYNGFSSVNGGYLDNSFISNSEDSLILMYRSNPSLDWAEHPDYEIDHWGNLNDKRGQVDIFDVQAGEYALAIYDAAVADLPLDDVGECLKLHTGLGQQIPSGTFIAFPNPVNDVVLFQYTAVPTNARIEIRDLAGRMIVSQNLSAFSRSVVFDLGPYPPGMYIANLISNDSDTFNSLKLMLIP